MMSLVIGLSVALGLGIAAARQNRKNQKMGASIEPVLRERGPLTLPVLAEALGMGSFYARGKVVLALSDLVNQGRVEVIPAPDGTPQLQKVNHIQYRWKG